MSVFSEHPAGGPGTGADDDTDYARRAAPVAVADHAEPVRLLRLIRLCGRGDQRAFDDLYRLTSSRVYGLILRFVGSSDVAARATHGVYLEVWRTSVNYRPEDGTVMAWLVMTARRHAALHPRSEAELALPDSEIAMDQEIVPTQVERVQRALAGLRSDHRAALELAYLDGLTHLEIARRLDLSPDLALDLISESLNRFHDALRTQP